MHLNYSNTVFTNTYLVCEYVASIQTFDSVFNLFLYHIFNQQVSHYQHLWMCCTWNSNAMFNMIYICHQPCFSTAPLKTNANITNKIKTIHKFKYILNLQGFQSKQVKQCLCQGVVQYEIMWWHQSISVFQVLKLMKMSKCFY